MSYWGLTDYKRKSNNSPSYSMWAVVSTIKKMLFLAPFCKQKITILYLLTYECSQWVQRKGTHNGSESNTSPSVTGTQNNQSEDTLDRGGPQHSQILCRNSRS